jgi:hypothetical protein
MVSSTSKIEAIFPAFKYPKIRRDKQDQLDKEQDAAL